MNLNMLDVIRAAVTTDRPCPFCGGFPPLATKKNGRHFVGCENEDCEVQPQVSSPALGEAWAIWNRRAP